MPTKFYVVPIIVLLIALVGSYFALLRDESKRKSLMSEATARVTNTDVRRVTDPESGKEFSVDVLVTYEYEINGVRFEKNVRKSKVESSRFVPWGNAKVCYDPSNQETIQNAELFPLDHVCGN